MSDEEVLFRVGRYKVLKELGKGGMGEVFLAYDPKRKGKVALKRLLLHRSENKKQCEQFLNEAKVLKRLSHPSIVPLLDVTVEDDQIYLSMPYIEGKSLKQLILEELVRELRGQEQDVTQYAMASALDAAKIFLQVVKAVAYAHSEKLLHRDIKPSNIIVQPSGQVCIIDWGLVTDYSHEKSTKLPFEEQDKIAGTAIYLAPELLLQQPPSVLSDIYSLGLVFYEMLTLRFPFHRSTTQEFASYYNLEVLVDPMQIVPYRGCTPPLSHIVLKCLAARPEERYQSVDEIVRDLEGAINDQESGKVAQERIVEAPDELEGTQDAILKFLVKAKEYQEKGEYKRAYLSFDELFERFSGALHKRAELEQAQSALFDCLQKMSSDDPEWPNMLLLGYVYLPVSFPLIRPDPDRINFMQIEEQKSWPEELLRKLYSVQFAYAYKRTDMLLRIAVEVQRVTPSPFVIIELVLLALGTLGGQPGFKAAYRLLDQLWQVHLDVQAFAKLSWIQKTLRILETGCTIEKIPFLDELPPRLTGEHLYPIFALLEAARRLQKREFIQATLDALKSHEMQEDLLARLSLLRL